MVYYVRLIDVFVTLACVMHWYVYRAGIDVGWGYDDYIVCYCLSDYRMCLYDYMFICYLCIGQGLMLGRAC